MATTFEKHTKHVGETAAMKDHDRDLIHELSRRTDFLWRCDQFIANADGHEELQDFWRDVKKQELGNTDKMRKLIQKEIKQDCF